ncbi:MAG: ATP-dependent DNA ligase [Limisphaerales bacterium]
MKRFTQLYCELDQTTRTNDKLAALERYFSEARPEDAAWALHFLAGRKVPSIVSSRLLGQWVAQETKLPDWLIGECYDAVGDLAETLALLLPTKNVDTHPPALHQLVENRVLDLHKMPEEWRREVLVKTWRELNPNERFLFNKLITGAFRVGVARTLVVRALANIAKVSPAVMAHRIMESWKPTAEDFQQLLRPQQTDQKELGQPYPFYLASPLQDSPESLGNVADWLAEWKWDGIRAQLIRRQGQIIFWSRGEEMVGERFPELVEAAKCLRDGTVLDGEILAWRDELPLRFGILQQRIGRKDVSANIRKEAPVVFQAFDVLEWNGEDIRERALFERRAILESIFKDASRGLPFRLSQRIDARSWEELAALQSQARERAVEGIMLKRWSSPYQVGRPRGDWWKWKIDPYLIDAVLIYAQPGSGRRASLFTDYTFGVWDNGQLVPVAKAYSGLSDDEIRQVDAFVRRNSSDKFGPVRIVKPELVFELAFEALQESTRHKAGIALRFPRINRWRRDKKAEDADTLQTVRDLLKAAK